MHCHPRLSEKLHGGEVPIFEAELKAKLDIAVTYDKMVVALPLAGSDAKCIEIKDGSYVASLAGSGQETLSKTFEYGPTALGDAIDPSPGFLSFSFHSYSSDGHAVNNSQRRLLIACNVETHEEQVRITVLCFYHHDTM